MRARSAGSFFSLRTGNEPISESIGDGRGAMINPRALDAQDDVDRCVLELFRQRIDYVS